MEGKTYAECVSCLQLLISSRSILLLQIVVKQLVSNSTKPFMIETLWILLQTNSIIFYDSF